MKAPTLLLVGLCLVMGACSSANPGAVASLGPDQELVGVRVENESAHNVVIYAVRHGMEMRLGRVSALRSESFRVPAVQLGGNSVRLAARTTTGVLLSQPFPIVAGQSLTWRLAERPGGRDGPREASLRIFEGFGKSPR